MITAEEARKLTEQNIKAKQDRELVLVNDLCRTINANIDKAIKDEKFEVQLMIGNLTAFQKNKIASYYQQLGYICNVTLQRGDYSCYISWSNQKEMSAHR